MVYVLNKDGQPLMPTMRHGKVRRLLKTSKAKVIRRCPFTIQLCYETDNCMQPIEVGDDTGSEHNGLSAVAVYAGRKVEIYASEVQMRTDITNLLSTRRECRRTRRNRKTRYRAPRFNNRKSSKLGGWVPPTVENKIHVHIRELEFICSILPVTKVTVEVTSFDMQKLKADWEGLSKPEGTGYQQGEMSGFWNAREYVLSRDGHTCQCCRGRSKDKVLNVHHIESRKTGGDAPNNLITLCETCHKSYHLGKIQLPKSIKRGVSFKDAAQMGNMRWTLYNRIKETFIPKGMEVHMTYGYITKNTRIEAGLTKSHCVDARCISGHPDAEPLGHYYYKKKVRCHNRQIHKSNILKGGHKKLNQAPYRVKGFSLFDKVAFNGKEYFIYGRRSTGYFDIRDLDGNKVNKGSISCKRLKLVEHSKSILTERRTA